MLPYAAKSSLEIRVFFRGVFGRLDWWTQFFFGEKRRESFFEIGKTGGFGLLVGKAPFFFGVIVWLVHEFGWKMMEDDKEILF